MSFNITNTLGPRVTAPFIPSVDTPSPPLAVGTAINGADGTEWLFVRLANSQTVAAGDFVYVSSIDGTWQVTLVSSAATRGLLGAFVGVAGAAATSGTSNNPFIWICRKGLYRAANVVTSSGANTLLRSSVTGGRITATAAAGVSVQLSGVVALAAAASNTADVMLNGAAVGAND